MSTLPAFLCLAGNEIGNSNRVLTYLRAYPPGLVSVDVELRPDRIAEPDGPVPYNLACFCEAIESADPTTPIYVTPTADPAPWYTASRPESADFLGLLITSMTLNSPFSRQVSPRGLLGSTLGGLRRGHRILAVEATMFASSAAGMIFAERWLHDALAGSGCVDEAKFLTSCECESAGQPTYDAAVLADAPFLFWKLGEPSGVVAADSSGNGRHGTYNGAPILGAAGGPSGGTAMQVDGVNDSVTVVLGALDMKSAEIWAYFPSTVTTATVAGSIMSGFTPGGIGASGLEPRWTTHYGSTTGALSNETLVYADQNGSTNVYSADTGVGQTIPAGWHLLTITYNNVTNRVDIYCDGVSVSDTWILTGQPDTVTKLIVGLSGAGGDPFMVGGRLQKFSVYTSQLSAARIAEHYAAASGGEGCGDTGPLRRLVRAGVVDGPVLHSLGEPFPECFTQGARFQIASELPWLMAEPETLLTPTAIAAPVCAAAAVTADWPGDAGLVVTFTSGAGIMDGLELTAVALQEGESDPTLRPPFLRATVRNLPPGRRIIYDSAEHTILEVEVSSGRVVGTVEHLDFAGPVRWLEVPPCGNVWACLDPTGATLDAAHTVEVTQVNREI